MGTSITSIPRTVVETNDPKATSHHRDWGEAFRLLSPLVIEMARKAGFTGDDQREVVQKVGLLLAEKLDELDPEKGTLRTWGAGIAHHVLLQMKRSLDIERRRREPNVSVKKLPASSLTPEQTLRARQALWILHAAVREEDRAVFELDALGGTAAEIGEQLGMPPATVEWRLKEARKRLVRGLARLHEDRSEATRVRGVVWPFATVAGFARDAPEEGACVSRLALGRAFFVRRAARLLRTARAAWSLRAGLLVLVPALLSVHLVVQVPEQGQPDALAQVPDSAGSANHAALPAPVAAPAPTAPAAMTVIVPGVTAAAVVPDRATLPPPAAAPPRARPFGGRRWMEYRVIVGAWRKRNAAHEPAVERP